MEVTFAESDKRIIKIGLWLLRKKLGESANREKIHDDLVNCGNDAIRLLTKIINNATNNIKEDYQKEIVNDLSEIGLWIVYKDTAYRDILFWILNEVLKNPDEFKKLIESYVIEPSKWHVNVWHEAKNFTKEKQKTGEIPETATSLAESVHFQEIQRQRVKEISKKLYGK